MMRRRIVFGGAIVLLIVIVLVINGCLKSEKQQSLKEYNHQVGELARESDSQVSTPLFTTLAGASGKSALDVEVQVNQLRMEAEKQAQHAKELKVPSEMTGAQRALLMAMNFRVEGITKIASLLPTALGGQAKTVSPSIAGAMETFLASDVLWSQRVAPLIQETLSAGGVHEQTQVSRFLPNLGWLEPETVESRLTGSSSASSTAAVSPGTHGSALVGVAVGTNSLQAEPELNHISGSSPTFTVTVEDSGSNAEKNVTVDVTVTAAGKALKGSKAISETQPGQKSTAEVPIANIPTGVAAKIEVYVQPVPGETELENNKGTYLAIFE